MSQLSTVQREQLRPRVQQWLNSQLRRNILRWLRRNYRERKVTLQNSIAGELEGLQLQLRISGAVTGDPTRPGSRTWMSEVFDEFHKAFIAGNKPPEVVSDGAPATPNQLFRWSHTLQRQGWRVSLLFSAGHHNASGWIPAGSNGPRRDMSVAEVYAAAINRSVDNAIAAGEL